ncbi:NEW3 domain-containing protein [Methanocalculus sp.]|uniref:COG1470 family protein n=1 Tax=Methanocalculus sp. TaxID=2004547 RepID=UPI002725AE46|nr:NEW3 domain-containing protein [Methanocalculus sp.]MDO8841929.1 NEW3 domain-containing protein [Methanocalculus sp.]
MIRRIFIIGLILCIVVTGDGAASTDYTKQYSISTPFPGRSVEAGTIISFPIVVESTGTGETGRLWVQPFAGTTDWDFTFRKDGSEVTQITLPSGSKETVTLEIETDSETPIGEYRVKVYVGDATLWLTIRIDETHKGEDGILTLKTVDEIGKAVGGVLVELKPVRGGGESILLTSASDGTLRTVASPGEYTVSIRKEGYYSPAAVTAKVRAGMTETLSDRVLQTRDTALTVAWETRAVTVTPGSSTTIALSLENIGRAGATFSLGTEGVPEGWSVRYRTGTGTTGQDISSVYLGTGDKRDIQMVITPKYREEIGEYTLTSVISTPGGDRYTAEIEASVRGSHGMEVSLDQYILETTGSDPLTFRVTVRNSGTAGDLTAVTPKISAPTGWNAEILPETVAGIAPGERVVFDVSLIPPSNVVASEYKFTMKVGSDQAVVEDNFRVAVKEGSFAAILGVMLLLIVGGGIYLGFRRHQRR